MYPIKGVGYYWIGQVSMQSTMLKGKLHQARVTHAVLEYEGSCAIDGNLLDMAGIQEYEQIQIYNIENGERFTTYAIRGEEGSGIISVNGAAAHLSEVGHRVIICAYAGYSQAELINFKPRLIYMNADNTVSHSSNAIPVQVA
jgi:aspartate 1-decarboxylase